MKQVLAASLVGFLILSYMWFHGHSEPLADYKLIMDPMPSKKEIKRGTDASIEDVFSSQLAHNNILLTLDKMMLENLESSPVTNVDYDEVKEVVNSILKKTPKDIYDFKFVEMSAFTKTVDNKYNILYTMTVSLFDKTHHFTRDFLIKVLVIKSKQFLLSVKLNMNEKDTSGVAWSEGELIAEDFAGWVPAI